MQTAWAASTSAAINGRSTKTRRMMWLSALNGQIFRVHGYSATPTYVSADFNRVRRFKRSRTSSMRSQPATSHSRSSTAIATLEREVETPAPALSQLIIWNRCCRAAMRITSSAGCRHSWFQSTMVFSNRASRHPKYILNSLVRATNSVGAPLKRLSDCRSSETAAKPQNVLSAQRKL